LAQPIAKSGENEQTEALLSLLVAHTMKIPQSVVKAAAGIKASGKELGIAASPGLEPALELAANVLLGGGTKKQALKQGMAAFAKTDAGKRTATKAAQYLAPALEEFVKRPGVAKQWGKIAEAAATKGVISGAISKATSVAFGPEGAKHVGSFVEKLLKISTQKGGFEKGIEFAMRASPKLVGMLGKLGKLVPGLGLAASLVGAIKVFTSKPPPTAAQKAAAVLDIAAGAAGLIPGLGTAAQVGISATSMAATSVADASAAQKALPAAKEPKGLLTASTLQPVNLKPWQPPA
jgi:hypothetical protein